MCPSCGDKKSFRRYIDTVTGQIVAEECGKCDHLNSCGYHYTPREYFKEHPEKKEDWRKAHTLPSDWARQQGSTEMGGMSTATTAAQTATCTPKETPVEKAETLWTIPYHFVEDYHSKESHFMRWIEEVAQRYGIAEERLTQVYEDYHLGADADGRVVFWQIDSEGRLRSGKWMQYTSDGHRSGHPNWMHSYLLRASQLPEDWELRQCLFGEHLIVKYPDKEICIVESEKTAIMCAMCYPDRLWLATGGCSGFSPEKLAVLRGRKVLVWPDSGAFYKWYGIFLQCKHIQADITDKLDRYPGNTDLADILLELAEIPPMMQLFRDKQ